MFVINTNAINILLIVFICRIVYTYTIHRLLRMYV